MQTQTEQSTASPLTSKSDPTSDPGPLQLRILKDDSQTFELQILHSKNSGLPWLLFSATLMAACTIAMTNLVNWGGSLVADSGTPAAWATWLFLSTGAVALSAVSLMYLLQCTCRRVISIDRTSQVLTHRNVPFLGRTISIDDLEGVEPVVWPFKRSFEGDVRLRLRGRQQPVSVLGIRFYTSLCEQELTTRCVQAAAVLATALGRPAAECETITPSMHSLR